MIPLTDILEFWMIQNEDDDDRSSKDIRTKRETAKYAVLEPKSPKKDETEEGTENSFRTDEKSIDLA
jgi:hypothetical protein